MQSRKQSYLIVEPGNAQALELDTTFSNSAKRPKPDAKSWLGRLGGPDLGDLRLVAVALATFVSTHAITNIAFAITILDPLTAPVRKLARPIIVQMFLRVSRTTKIKSCARQNRLWCILAIKSLATAFAARRTPSRRVTKYASRLVAKLLNGLDFRKISHRIDALKGIHGG